MRSRPLRLAGLVLMALASSGAWAFGQAVYGSIVGTVTDSTGAAVPGATVTVTNVAQGVSFSTTSNQTGDYQQTHLIVGVYDVKVEAKGFQAFVQKGVQVNVDANVQVNATLQLGQVTQTVEVTAAVPILKTEKTDVATSFSERQVTELPIFNRNFTQFELLSPGTQRLGWQHAASENPQGAIQIMVNGQHFSGTDYQLDGTANQDPILGIIVINPNLDSVTEAKVTTADYDAEFGEATAGVVTSQTKSGTNTLHGSAFEFNRTNATSARDPFQQCGAACGVFNVPHSTWNQFGGSLGGPIKKDKSFIFGDFQGTRRALGGSAGARVPTAAERSGDLSDLNTPIFDPFDSSGNVIAPAQRTQFAEGVIPTALLDPGAVALLNKWIPLPNATPANAAANNYFASGSQTFNSDGFDVRADHYYSDKLHLFGRYSFQRFSRQGPGLFGLEAGGPTFTVDPSVGGFAGSSSVRNQSIAFGFDRTVSPTLLTDFRFGFERYRVFVNPNGLGTSPAKDAGIQGLNLDNYYTSGMPYFNITGTGGFDFGYSLGANQCNCPLNEQEQQFQFVNNWTDIRGNHTLKFGADLRFAENLRVPSDSHRAGELTFDPGFTEGPAANDVGLGIASYLLGGVTFFQRYVSNVTTAAERQKRWFFYGQDTWRVTPKLTVNYGLRWELYFPESVNGASHGGWLDVNTGEDLVAGTSGVNLSGNVGNPLTNFAPRIGIAYQLKPTTVVRLGYGRSFDIGTFGSIFGHNVTQNLPVLAQQQLTSPAGYADAFALDSGPPSLDPTTLLDNNCQAAGGGPNPITNPDGTKTQCLGATGRPLYPDGVSPHVRPRTERLLTVDAWNATLQHAFSNSLSGEIAYVANKGTHVFNGDGPNYDTNTPFVVPIINGVPTIPRNQRKPYYNLYGWTQGVQWYGNDVSNSYESLQARVEKRFSNGYSILAHYTFAHAYQYDGDGYYIYNGSVVRGPSDFQRDHVFVLTHIWELPFGKGKRYLGSASRLVDAAVGGWQLTGSWTVESGVPFTYTYNECGQDIDTGPCMVSLTGAVATGPRSGNPQITGYWFQPAAAALAPTQGGTCPSDPGCTSGPFSRPASGTFGNSGINRFFGPRLFDADLSIFKTFTITERVHAQLRAESFNALNHVNLSNPNSCVDCTGAGSIGGLAAGTGMRTWQFGLKFEF